MSRINTNIDSLIAQNSLVQNQQNLSTSLERLSTGLQINSGADNPAGLIASQSLASQNASIAAGLANAQQAGSMISTADGGLSQIQTLLTQMQSLVSQAANTTGMTSSQLSANQMQVDTILQSINKIANTTTFNGAQLLNGTYDFAVTGKSASVASYEIDGAQIANGGTQGVVATVTASAQHGALYLSFGIAAASLSFAGGANPTKSFSFNVTGALGSQTFSFASGTKLSAIMATVNASKSITGVSAFSSGKYIRLNSTQYGANNFVSFNLNNAGGQSGGVQYASAKNENKMFAAAGTAFTAGTPVVDKGQDVAATINGTAAQGNGLTASLNTAPLAGSITFTSGAAKALATIAAFTVTDSGAKFSIGPNASMASQSRIGLQNVSTTNLGSVNVGYLNQLGSGQTYNLVNGDMSTAQNIVNAAISQVSTMRGRLGAFQNFVVGSTSDNLQVMQENISSAQSAIQDTNFASETANLTRSQILVSAATQVLSIANANPKNVLTLLQNA
jgi:flagellin